MDGWNVPYPAGLCPGHPRIGRTEVNGHDDSPNHLLLQFQESLEGTLLHGVQQGSPGTIQKSQLHKPGLRVPDVGLFQKSGPVNAVNGLGSAS